MAPRSRRHRKLRLAAFVGPRGRDDPEALRGEVAGLSGMLETRPRRRGDPVSTDEIVYWALLGIVGGAASLAMIVAGWLLQSHLALIREFDQFKGKVNAEFETTEGVKERVADMLAPIVTELRACVALQRRQGRLLDKMAAKMHIPAVDEDDDDR